VNTAGLVIIGDEILNGKVKDENSFVFANIMFERGIELKRIITIPDDKIIIGDVIREFMSTYTYVASSGGIGPTHDDITLEAIALGLKRPLRKHEEAVRYFQEAQEKAGRGSVISDVQLKMLSYPESSLIYFTKPLWLPLIRIDNLFVFPGVPSLFTALIHDWAHLFCGHKFYRELIYTDNNESSIAKALGMVQSRYESVKIGSYPQEPTKSFRVMVSIEGINQNHVHEATHEIMPLIKGRKSL
jgi:molybdenum cofactor synthesis domain-containing protein